MCHAIPIALAVTGLLELLCVRCPSPPEPSSHTTVSAAKPATSIPVYTTTVRRGMMSADQALVKSIRRQEDS